MIGKSYKWDGGLISKKTDDFQIAIQVCEWRKKNFNDESSDIDGSNGVDDSRTYVRGRRIFIAGIIRADNKVGLSKGRDYLDSLFRMQSRGGVVERKVFSATDEQDREWEINARIKDPVDIEIEEDDWMEGADRKWNVVLFANDARLFGAIEKVATGIESNYGGMKLGVKLGVKMNSNYGYTECYGEGSEESPVEITLNCTGDVDGPVIIKNITDGSSFVMDIDGVDGDVIVVNSKDETITKNGVSQGGARQEGSVRPIVLGTTRFLVFDKDGGLYDSDFDIEITFNDVLM